MSEKLKLILSVVGCFILFISITFGLVVFIKYTTNIKFENSVENIKPLKVIDLVGFNSYQYIYDPNLDKCFLVTTNSFQAFNCDILPLNIFNELKEGKIMDGKESIKNK